MKFPLFLLAFALLAGSSFAVQLTYEMRVDPAGCSPGVVVSDDHKNATVNHVGDVVGLQLFAIVNSADADHSDDGFITGQGSFLSIGNLLGNLRGDIGTTATQTNNVAPFDFVNAQSGFQADLDGDGDLDVGSSLTTGLGLVIQPWFRATSENGAGTTPVLGTGSGNGPTEFLIGQTTFTVGGGEALGQQTAVNFIPRVRTDGSPLGKQLHQFLADGVVFKLMGTDANLATGAPVTIAMLPPPVVLTSVTIASNNANPAYAKLGDIVTAIITADQPLASVSAMFGSSGAVGTLVSGNTWKLPFTVDHFVAEGVVPLSIFATGVSGASGGAKATTDDSSVTVDTTPPILTVPSTQVVEATNPIGATVNYPAASATDANAVTLIYSRASGTTFPFGNTNVMVTATDAAGNSTSGGFMVTVHDTTPPVLTILGANPVTVEAGPAYVDAGATASDTAAGNLTGAIQVSSNVNGKMPGDYSVSYSVSDGYNPVSATRIVHVVDTTAPTITHVPAAITVVADATNHAAVADFTGDLGTTDNVGVTQVTQDPPPGTIVGFGPHIVTLTVSDAAQHTVSCTTTFTVEDGPALPGRYAGLLTDPQGAVHALMELKLTRGRFLTGYLRLDNGKRVWFPGTVLPAATHAETLALNDGSSLALTFDGFGHVAATRTGGEQVLTVDGVLADAGAPAGVPGKYTAVLDPEEGAAPGWLYVVVSSHGAMRISGKLPDGSTVGSGQGSIVDRHGDALVFVLGKGGGRPLLAGQVHFASQAASDFAGALTFKGAPCAASGAKFTPASSGLPAGPYPLAITGAGLNIASTVTLRSDNSAGVLAPVVSFKPRTGLGHPATGIFYLTFRNPAAPSSPLIKSSGIFDQKLGIGVGQFSFGGTTGRVQLGTVPAP